MRGEVKGGEGRNERREKRRSTGGRWSAHAHHVKLLGWWWFTCNTATAYTVSKHLVFYWLCSRQCVSPAY